MGDAVVLAGLALLDSTSLGTLVVPLALIIGRRRVDVGPLAIYLATIVVLYLALGLGLVAGIDVLVGPLSRALSTEPAQWIKLVLGIALAAFGILAPSPKTRECLPRQVRSLAPGAMIALGAGATLAEAATMVPYLAATGIVAGMPIGWPGRVAVMAAYCLVMILPVVVLAALAAVLGQRVWPRLERWLPVIERETKTTLLWVAAIGGLYLARSGWVAIHA